VIIAFSQDVLSKLSYLRFGLCLPSSCAEEEIVVGIQKMVDQYDLAAK
jgi:hypothetical protein